MFYAFLEVLRAEDAGIVRQRSIRTILMAFVE